MNTESVPNDRCGKTTTYTTPEMPGNVTCWRKPWPDHDRCIWHARVSEKPAKELSKARTGELERLDGAFLKDIDLDGSISFDECVLVDADLERSDVSAREATGLSQWDLDEPSCSFREADLRRANLIDADFTDAMMRNATLANADCWNAKFIDADLVNADLSHADFSFADLWQAILRGATTTETKFLDADLTGVDLSATDLTTAKMRGVDLTDSDLRKSNATGNTFFGADLTSAKLQYTSFTDADLQDCALTNADARDSDFDRAKIESATFTGADLRGASLVDAGLYHVQFSDTLIDRQTDFGESCIYEAEDVSLPRDPAQENDSSRTRPLEASAWVYRRLESLHEENAMADRTRQNHIRKEEAQRELDRRQGNYGRYVVATLNRYLTKHGESIKHLLVASAVTIVSAGLLYPFIGGVEDGGTVYQAEFVAEPPSMAGLAGATEALARGLYFSTITFTTVGYANVAPHGLWSRVLVGIESLVGAILIALFVYVLGRRVAR